MAVPGSINELLIGAAGAGAEVKEIERSLRFNSDDSAYLDKTPLSEGNRRKFTLSCWVKKATNGVNHGILNAGATSASNGVVQFYFASDDRLTIYARDSSGTAAHSYTTALYRDPSAWYHIVFAVDTAQSAFADQQKLYVNGVQVDSWNQSQVLTQDTELLINSTTAHYIGGLTSSGGSLGNYLSGYLADYHFIDGQALGPTDFGKSDDNGVWQPIEYAGTYGTNGFHLDFSDNSSAAALGTDTSGNGNDWTVNNISVSPGADNDSLFDSPTNGTQTDTGAGGEVSGNYATWNPLIITTNNTLSQGNLQATHAASTSWSGNSQQAGSAMFVGNIGMSSGKWYWEVAIDFQSPPGTSCVGIVDRPGGHDAYVGYSANVTGAQGWGWANTGTIYHTSGITNDGGTLSTYNFDGTNILGFALDMDNGRLYVSLNGTYENSGDPELETGYCASGMSGTYYFAGSQLSANSKWIGTVNTGQRAFANSAPTGYKALCTTNLSEPTIADGTDYFEPLPWTGDGTGSRVFTGLSFEPSLTWVKIRTQSYTHILFDAVRTAGSGKELQPNSTNIEGQADTNLYGYLSSFDSNGFSSTAGTTDNDYFNKSGNTYVAWNWNAGTSTVSNTDGSINSSVRANPSAGFSIVSYTGTGSAGTIGHGLNVEPSFLIVKTTETAAATNWTVYHKSVGNTEAAYFDTSPFSPSIGYWNNTSPTSSVVTVGNFDVVNAPSKELIMYAFAPVAGYSAFGTYVGNGVAGNGTFVELDFAPAFVIIKAVDYASANWVLFDNKRPGYNLNSEPFYVNLSDPDGSSYRVVDLLSNGFKLRDPGGNSAALADTNAASETYMYAAFAENPFKISRAR